MQLFRPAAPQQPGTNADSESQEITRSLYKQNLELAIKNKTLSLLEKLYKISILTLDPDEASNRITTTIQADFNFERVSILRYDYTTDTLTQLAAAESERFKAARAGLPSCFDAVAMHDVLESGFFHPVIEGKRMGYTEQLEDVWTCDLPGAIVGKLASEGHAHSVIAHPLIIGSTVIGVCILVLNRVESEVSNYERQAMQNFTNVISVALDKAILYEQLKESNDQLAAGNARLRELDQQKTEFVSIASHQLRSPLTAMTGYASLILEGAFGQLPSEMREAVMRIFESGKTMAVAIDDFLNVTRIEQGKMVYTYEEFPLHALVKQTVAELQLIAERKGLALAYDSNAGGVSVCADKGKVKQIVTNLIDNAIKYTKEGTVTISVSTEEPGQMASIRITDTGIGLSSEDKERLFKKFSRAQNANEISVKGTGLGLFIALEMAHAQGGTITVASEGRGKGSTFTFTIPLKPSPKSPGVV